MMKNFCLALLFLTLTACNFNSKATMENIPVDFYIGTYTDANSQGIYSSRLQPDGTFDVIKPAAEINNPSFLARSNNGRFLLAVSETTVGALHSFEIQGDTLNTINSKETGGAHPCFVTINKAGDVLVANYTGGSIGYLRLDEKGKLSDLLDLKQHIGSGSIPRQDAPHAHSAWFDTISGKIIAVDLGTNELWFYELNHSSGQLLPAKQAKLEMTEGAGPRHLDFHPNGKWIYVLNELDCTVSVLDREADSTYSEKQSITTLPLEFHEQNTCADIHVSPDGRFVYASNRGHNSIAIFAVNDSDGTLQSSGNVLTRGETPRNFSLSPNGKFLLVANQDSDNIVSFLRDEQDGSLRYVSEIKVPKPVCILF